MCLFIFSSAKSMLSKYDCVFGKMRCSGSSMNRCFTPLASHERIGFGQPMAFQKPRLALTLSFLMFVPDQGFPSFILVPIFSIFSWISSMLCDLWSKVFWISILSAARSFDTKSGWDAFVFGKDGQNTIACPFFWQKKQV